MLVMLQAKLERRIKAVDIKVLNAPRPGKKLLVIDIDYTIFDLGSSAERPMDLARCGHHMCLGMMSPAWMLAVPLIWLIVTPRLRCPWLMPVIAVTRSLTAERLPANVHTCTPCSMQTI